MAEDPSDVSERTGRSDRNRRNDDRSELGVHHLRVERTARYYTLGAPTPKNEGRPLPEELWFVCHGYRQSAERFLERFRPVADPRRLVIAPEGLSRFYIGPADGRHGSEDRVGASWMTREDREAEIRDYVQYLDALEARVTGEIGWTSRSGAPPKKVEPELRRVVLGFSQGVHTAARWVAKGKIRPDHLVLWGAYLPGDLEMKTAAPRLRALRLTLVRGTRDETADAGLQKREEQRLEDWDIPYSAITFDGGHRLDDEVLRKLAGES